MQAPIWLLSLTGYFQHDTAEREKVNSRKVIWWKERAEPWNPSGARTRSNLLCRTQERRRLVKTEVQIENFGLMESTPGLI